jgi:predicted secreted protein
LQVFRQARLSPVAIESRRFTKNLQEYEMQTGLKTLTTALLFSSALVVNAQTPPQQAQPQTYPSKPSATQPATQPADQLTIAGCLKQEPGASKVENAPPAENSFVLSDVKMGATSPASAIGLAPKYAIQGLTDVELQKHVGHTVEITGRITPAAAAADSKETAPMKRDLPEFQASSVKMISGTCTAK